eukprot:CAMPEP_0180097914 /NCGR_PEP_ID=MMETSP0985-20121206/27473_1 /TAXON_ID=483367 /ORGANISM="non described non described, Strain CCMP 2436" /LENGTH=348 /DNA_ID=CAMNT_0022033323 /DNA_START=525 /DNA_END=1570 /DNA_ORIENTATION=-
MKDAACWLLPTHRLQAREQERGGCKARSPEHGGLERGTADRGTADREAPACVAAECGAAERGGTERRGLTRSLAQLVVRLRVRSGESVAEWEQRELRQRPDTGQSEEGRERGRAGPGEEGGVESGVERRGLYFRRQHAAQALRRVNRACETRARLAENLLELHHLRALRAAVDEVLALPAHCARNPHGEGLNRADVVLQHALVVRGQPLGLAERCVQLGEQADKRRGVQAAAGSCGRAAATNGSDSGDASAGGTAAAPLARRGPRPRHAPRVRRGRAPATAPTRSRPSNTQSPRRPALSGQRAQRASTAINFSRCLSARCLLPRCALDRVSAGLRGLVNPLAAHWLLL